VREAIERAALDQPAVSPAAHEIPVDHIVLATRKPIDRPLTAPAFVLGEDHATPLDAEVLASSVHPNILCPKGPGCRTWNFS